MQEQKTFQPDCHLYYMKGINLNNPEILMKMQTNHIMMLFFYVGGLHILQKECMLDDGNMKQKIVNYILSLQLKNGGFTSSSLYAEIQQSSKFYQSHIVFTYSAVNTLKILGALDKVDKTLILKNIARHQKQDGSFSSFEDSTQCDLRFVYSALSICRVFDDFSTINKQKAKQYIDLCYNFDGGYGLRPKNQSHCGAIYCAIASYEHLNEKIPKQKKLKTIHFLAHRQATHQQDSKLIGVQGRVGKYIDSCYGFWAGAALKMLSNRNLLNPQISKFLMKCYKSDQRSFSKYMENKAGDPIHTYHSVTGLKIINEEAQNISLSQLLRKQNI